METTRQSTAVRQPYCSRVPRHLRRAQAPIAIANTLDATDNPHASKDKAFCHVSCGSRSRIMVPQTCVVITPPGRMEKSCAPRLTPQSGSLGATTADQPPMLHKGRIQELYKHIRQNSFSATSKVWPAVGTTNVLGYSCSRGFEPCGRAVMARFGNFSCRPRIWVL